MPDPAPTPPRPAAPSLLLPLFASLTLGLAPFRPEPHVVEKLRWLATGQAFRAIDVVDLTLHGSPWLWLGVAIAWRFRSRQGAGAPGNR
ncbi:MAG: RND transporter [Holophagales bacterium]|jgi:hypothetical protein|nr:MAG: RND transporter [Holophagales bacterium]